MPPFLPPRALLRARRRSSVSLAMSTLARVAARRLARARSSPTALLPARSFAYKPKVEAPPHLQGRATQIRAFLKSPNVIADPYRGPRPWPSLSSFLGLAGWKQLGALMLRPVKDVYTLGKLQSVPGFTRPAFREEARDMYREISRMIAENHHTALRNFCSEKALQEIKREVKRRERGGWTKVDWRLVAFDAGTPTVLQGRMVAPNAKDRSVEFAQFTVRFESRQTYAAYDRKGKLVSGDPSEEVAVSDVWVFERGVGNAVPNPRWRLAARLSVPNLSEGETVGGERLDPNIG